MKEKKESALLFFLKKMKHAQHKLLKKQGRNVKLFRDLHHMNVFKICLDVVLVDMI